MKRSFSTKRSFSAKRPVKRHVDEVKVEEKVEVEVEVDSSSKVSLKLVSDDAECLDMGNWTHVNVGKEVTDAGVQALANRSPQLLEVNLNDCCQVTDVGVQTLAKHCPQLLKVNLKNCCQVTTTGVQALIDDCKQLKVSWSDCEKVNNHALLADNFFKTMQGRN